MRLKELVKTNYPWTIPLRNRVLGCLGRPLGIKDTQWIRIVMDQETTRLIRALPYEKMDALEISGNAWEQFGFGQYQNVYYPTYDVCKNPLAREKFDIILAEQVWEHLLWPYRATGHVWQMLRMGGYFLVTTPFLIRIHGFPVDCTRWTEVGLKHLLAETGFSLNHIVTGSWGNRRCVHANFTKWARRVPWMMHSLRNEELYPVSVWALAQKTTEE